MPNTVEHYLSRGCDQQMAEYFAAGRKRISGAVPGKGYTLVLSFDNGERRIYSVAHLIQDNTVFSQLRDLDTFRSVYLDADGCVSWDTVNGKIDLCPDCCYVDSTPV